MFKQLTQQIDKAVRELDFDQSVVNIGSHLDNDIVITDDSVLPFHAMVVLQEKNFQLVSLTPGAEVWLNGDVLEDTSVSLAENHLLEIGGHTLFFQRFDSSTGMHVVVSKVGADVTSLTSRFAMQEGEEAILVNVLSQQTEVNVEQRAVFELEVVNAGPIVASFFVSIKGVPQDWVKIKPDVFNLNEGQRAMVSVAITPPRESASTAGVYDINIVVSSPNYPGYRVETPSELVVQPYYEFSLGNLSPKKQRISWRKRTGVSILPVKNLGNSTTDFNVKAIDDENGCSFDFQVSDEVRLNRQATLTIPAGETLDLPIEITPLKHPMFALRSKRYHYTTTVTVPQQATSPQTISASVISRPLFGWWSIMLGFLAILVGLFVLLQPRISSFQVATGKDVIELGDTTKLEWSVSPFATRLSIDNIDYPIERGQKSITIAPTRSTTYELVSGNWLSGLVGLDRKATQTILVVPPSPRVGVFEVDSTTIDKGKPINIRWSVLEADQVFLTVDEVVYELTPEQFSGEQAYILEKDALITLEAKNASGSELRSYFVNVVPPHISVDAFTVWVKSEDSASNYQHMAANSSGGHMASKIYVADSNFPEKLVTLVSDATSDSGYRAETLQPNRELAKGEQILVEWSIGGVDTVQIAPFTDALPSSGMQPFFPQESMNFVMTAKSGELEQIFMLPVKVFDGEPPVAPEIEFFKASPSKMVGEGEVEFAWSVSGEWTRVQLSSGDNVIADYLNPQGFKKITVDATKSFILTAWNGELTSAEIIEVVVDPALIETELTITQILPEMTYFRVGDTVDVFVDFTDPETGEQPDPYPKGAVVVSDGRSVCTIALPTRTCSLTFNAAGTKVDENGIKASYEGDAVYLPTDSEIFIDRSIIVEANQVELNPVYYHLNQSGDAGEQINNLSAPDPELSVGRGLLIDVIVKPINKPLNPEDDKGQVTVRYCPLDENDEVQEQDCLTALPVTVVVEDTDTAHAEVVIRQFPEIGDYALLISYNHREDAYEPVSLGEDGSIDFTVEKGQIVFIPDGKDPCDTEECILIQNQSGYTFFAKLLIEPGWLKMLSTTYLEPNSIDMVLKDGGGVIINDWSEKCVWQKTGNDWQYYCDGVSLDQPATLEYRFEIGDDNYKIDPVPDTIKLNVKEATILDFPNGKDFLNNKYVGTVIDIQPDNIVLKKEAENGDAIAGDIELTIYTKGQEISSLEDYFIVPNGSTNCTISGSILTISQDAAVTGVCQLASKKAGDYTLNFEYQGDGDYNGATASVELAIAKQTGIEVEWTPSGAFNWEIFSENTEDMTFRCPNSTHTCADFDDEVLTGASLQIDFSQAVGCKVKKDSTELTGGKFTLGSTTEQLKFRCNEVGSKILDMAFADSSVDDFSLIDGGSQDLTVGKLSKNVSPEVRINDNGLFEEYPLADDRNPTPAPVWDDIKALYRGEEYWIVVTLDGMPSDDDIKPDTTDTVKVVWPSALDSAMDDAQSTCDEKRDVDNNGVYYLPLQRDANDSTTWIAKCKVRFSSKQNLSAGDEITVSLPDSDRVSSSEQTIALPNGVIEDPVVIETKIVGGEKTGGDYYTLSSPDLKITFDDHHYQADVEDSLTKAVVEATIQRDGTTETLSCTKETGLTFLCDLPDDKAWSDEISVEYNDSSSVFANTTHESATFTMVTIPVEIKAGDIVRIESGASKPFPQEMVCKNCGSANSTGTPADSPWYFITNETYTVRVSVEDTVVGYDQIVNQGKLTITFPGGNASNRAHKYSETVDVKNGVAEFTLNFHGNDKGKDYPHFTLEYSNSDAFSDDNVTVDKGENIHRQNRITFTEDWKDDNKKVDLVISTNPPGNTCHDVYIQSTTALVCEGDNDCWHLDDPSSNPKEEVAIYCDGNSGTWIPGGIYHGHADDEKITLSDGLDKNHYQIYLWSKEYIGYHLVGWPSPASGLTTDELFTTYSQ